MEVSSAGASSSFPKVEFQNHKDKKREQGPVKESAARGYSGESEAGAGFRAEEK